MRAVKKTTTLELLAVAALTLLYFFSFRRSSPLNGPTEVFGQDSVHIVRSLTSGRPYRFNPQHHLLYHALTVWGWRRLVRPFLSPSAQAVYVYLKVFTALTGAAFLLTLLALLKAMALPPLRRLVLLLFAAFSVTAWFNFAGMETHSLALWSYNVFLLCMLRLTQDKAFRVKDAILVIVALVFAALARLDNARLLLLAAPLLPTLSLTKRRRFAAALGLAIVLGCAGYLFLGKAYFAIPLRQVPHHILARQDRHHLSTKMKRMSNINPRYLTRMGQATSIYTVMMAPGRNTFTSPLKMMLRHPLSSAALGGMLLFWGRVLLPLGRGLWRRDSFLWPILTGWVAGLLFFTWFNPFEPFIWLLEFLPLLVGMAAYTLRKAGRMTWIFLTLLTVVTAAHNWISFYRRYDL